MLIYRIGIIVAGIVSASLVYPYTLPQRHILGVSNTQSPTIVMIATSIPTPTVTLTPSPTRIPTTVPTATFTPSPTQSPASVHEEYFDRYSNQYSVDKELLKRIAQCESGMRPDAQNGPYGGMFQYTESTWQQVRTRMGGDSNPALRFDKEKSIETAAYQISQDGTTAWRGCL